MLRSCYFVYIGVSILYGIVSFSSAFMRLEFWITWLVASTSTTVEFWMEAFSCPTNLRPPPYQRRPHRSPHWRAAFSSAFMRLEFWTTWLVASMSTTVEFSMEAFSCPTNLRPPPHQRRPHRSPHWRAAFSSAFMRLEFWTTPM